MHIHFLQHVQFEEMGCIGNWAFQNNHTLTGTRLFNGDRLPEAGSFDWLLIMGGPMGVNDEKLFPWLKQEKKLIEDAIKNNKKVLGICLGAQLIAAVLGSSVRKNRYREIGWFPLSFTPEALKSPLSILLSEPVMAFHWHSDMFEIPPGAVGLASSKACAHQAFMLNNQVLGLQFHLEITEPGALELIKHCGQEMVAGDYIQTSSQIFSNRTLFPRANYHMDRILDGFQRFL
jgi:GMP synthase-like glutamine amidotransferase